MVKKSLLWVYRTALWLTGTALSIILIAALTLHFWVMPNIGQFKNDIAAFASKAAQQKVTIGDIKANWQGFNPHLSLSNIDIFDAQNRAALHLGNADVSLSWLSIPLLEPHLDELIIYAPELTIRRVASGEIFIAGMSMRGDSKPDLPNWLLRQNRLGVNNAKIIWLDELRNAPSLNLDNLNLEIFSPPWRSLIRNHSFILSATPSVGTNSPIQLSGSFYGNDVTQTAKWRGNVSMQLKNADLAAFRPWVNYPIDLQSGIGSTDVTVQFANNQVQSVTSKVSIENLQLQLKPSTAAVSLGKLVGDINWKNLNKFQLIGKTPSVFGHSVSVEHLSVSASNGLNLQDVNADYMQTNEGKQAFNLKLANVNLANIQSYASQLPLPDALLAKLAAASPQGELENVDLHWEALNSNTSSYRIDAKFNHFTVLAQDTIPGFSNLSGGLSANQKTGRLQLNSRNSTLDFKGILRWPIPAESLNGEINWNIKNNVTNIDVNALNISSPHLSGRLDANYKMDGIKGGLLDLKGKFGSGNAKYALFYYPIMLGETTLHWLDTSILAGHAEDINLVVKGRLGDFPFVDSKNNLDQKQGLFRVTAKVSDALLEYGTGWPAIDKLGLNLLFEGKRMELNANTGNILGNQLVKSKTTIEQLDADYPILSIDSELTGPVSEGINFVNKSPVLEVTQGFTEDLKTSGAGKLNLSLKIPMQDLEAAKYKGLYQITNGKMESGSIPTLSRINGFLEFTESSLSAKNIQASAFGSPLTFNLSSGKDKSIRVAARGRLSDESIKQLLTDQNLAKGASYISGSTDWVGDILIQKPRVSIGIRSDLTGITSRFPAPFDKSAYQQLSLRVDKKQDASSENIYINLGNKISAKIISSTQNGKAQFEQAHVNFNSDSTSSSLASNLEEPSNSKGLSVTGNLDYLDADAWRYVIKNLADINSTDANQPTRKLPIQKVALKINALDIFDRRINQLKISNIANKEGLQANIQSKEISGDLHWANQDNGKLIARLSNLSIPDAAPDTISAIKDSDAETSTTSFKKFIKLEQDYPALDIIADNFEFNKKSFGAFELIAYPQNDNWNIQKLKFTTTDSTMSAEGQWNNWVRSPNTFLNISWEIKDLGKTLKRFGYADTVKDGEGELTGRLHWPGSPHQFETTRLNGELQFEIHKGQILQAQPGVGRLLGLLSLQSLPRRLTLDFRDLFSNGFAFDKIKANVRIEQGVMRSDNFAMSGPAADVSIKGETNLQKETQHLFIKVMPRISDSVSLAALAGGPLVGAVAFLAQKLLKDPLNKIASTEYEIIGTWDDPQEVKNTDNKQQSNNASPLN